MENGQYVKFINVNCCSFEDKMTKKVNKETLDNVTIRFAGDSGDGMQLSGGRFTQTAAIVGIQ